MATLAPRPYVGAADREASLDRYLPSASASSQGSSASASSSSSSSYLTRTPRQATMSHTRGVDSIASTMDSQSSALFSGRGMMSGYSDPNSQIDDTDDDDGGGLAHDGPAAGSEEYVVALHDFSSSNATCLSFTAGQVIKVFNRDASGWWDGELDGQRGWFPSNYVDEDGMSVGSPAPHHLDLPVASGAESMARAGHRSSIQYAGGLTRSGSRSPTPTANSMMTAAPSPIVEPILHAIALLHNAVRANRVAHFQPSTACVISSVRSVLSATDCLTRESRVLKVHPILARERKHILAELSRLVTQARKASSPPDEGEAARAQDLEDMLRMSQTVYRNVTRFLEVAVECGVPVPDRRSSVYDDLYAAGRASYAVGAMPDRSEQDKTPTPESPRSSAYQTAYTSGQYSPRSTRSFMDLRSAGGYFDEASGAHAGGGGGGGGGSGGGVGAGQSQAARIKALAQARERADSMVSESATSTSAGSGSGSGEMSNSGSIESFEAASGPVVCSAPEVLQRLSQANDHLLSIIAAFIGHLHTHTRDSHASSYAHLIDMTREAVDGVRELLAVVEAVNNSPELQAQLPRQTAILWDTRESLYEATTSLVSAARIVTSAPITGDPNAPTSAAEDEEKARLLSAATAVLRTGGECVGAVRLCLNRADSELRLTLPGFTSSSSARAATVTAEPETIGDDTLGAAADEASETPLREGRPRRKHTLSFLGRKATSLSCLREKYEVEHYQAGFKGIAEDDSDAAGLRDDDEDEDEELQRAMGDDGNVTLRQRAPSNVGSSVEKPPSLADRRRAPQLPVVDARRRPSNPPPVGGSGVVSAPARQSAFNKTAKAGNGESNGGDSSDSSEPMSRDHSRASGSTVHSINSEATADTSARPSMDREARPPHTAPIHGSFPKGNGVEPRPHASEPPATKLPASASGGAASSSSSASVPVIAPAAAAAAAAAATGQDRFMRPDHDPVDICYNSEGQVTGATLEALVEKMTPHDSTIDATFSNAFFLCFRLFTTPVELFDVLEARYNMRPPPEVEMSAEEFTVWTERKVTPVRLRIFNFFKTWLETHWHAPTDHVILQRLINFTQTSMTHSLHRPGQRLGELAQKRLVAGAKRGSASGAATPPAALTSTAGPGSLTRMVSIDKLGALSPALDTANMYTSAAFARRGPAPPQPTVSKAVMNQLRTVPQPSIHILDFDPLELARQMTIMESKIYCSILPEELLGQEFSKKQGVSNAVNIKKMSALTTYITGWISECILGEEDARKRTQLVKFFIKLGDRCLGLNNFNTLMAIQCALNSSTIARLRRTWDGLPTKYRGMMEHQRHIMEHTRNFAGYRARLRNTFPPALPFVGLFLTDLTFCHEGNAATRPSPLDPTRKLLNFDKYVKMSRIIGDLQRFQVPYTLLEVGEMQTYLDNVLTQVQKGGANGTADDLYRRSLLLEPRAKNGNDTISAGSSRSGSSSKLGLDLLNWH